MLAGLFPPREPQGGGARKKQPPKRPPPPSPKRKETPARSRPPPKKERSSPLPKKEQSPKERAGQNERGTRRVDVKRGTQTVRASPRLGFLSRDQSLVFVAGMTAPLGPLLIRYGPTRSLCWSRMPPRGPCAGQLRPHKVARVSRGACFPLCAPPREQLRATTWRLAVSCWGLWLLAHDSSAAGSQHGLLSDLRSCSPVSSWSRRAHCSPLSGTNFDLTCAWNQVQACLLPSAAWPRREMVKAGFRVRLAVRSAKKAEELIADVSLSACPGPTQGVGPQFPACPVPQRNRGWGAIPGVPSSPKDRGWGAVPCMPSSPKKQGDCQGRNRGACPVPQGNIGGLPREAEESPASMLWLWVCARGATLIGAVVWTGAALQLLALRVSGGLLGIFGSRRAVELVEVDLEAPGAAAEALGTAGKLVCAVGAPQDGALKGLAPFRSDRGAMRALISQAGAPPKWTPRRLHALAHRSLPESPRGSTRESPRGSPKGPRCSLAGPPCRQAPAHSSDGWESQWAGGEPVVRGRANGQGKGPCRLHLSCVLCAFSF